MAYFYKKNDEIFIPEKVNPDLAKLAKGIVKTCHLSFKLQMRTTGLNNALKKDKREDLIDIINACLKKNKPAFTKNMSLSGAAVAEVDDSFFDDKDIDFLKNQINVLIDQATISTVVDAKMLPLMGAACEKVLGVKLNEIFFFTNQGEILKDEEEEDDGASDETTE